MPLYEYKCNSCGGKFEFRKGIEERDDALVCPKCNSKNISRIYSFFFANTSGDSCAPTDLT